MSKDSVADIAKAASAADVPLASTFNGPASVSSMSDARTTNNVMRHAFRVLSAEEKLTMQKIKDMGLELHGYFESLGTSRELSVAKTKIEEAVMWAVKHLTR